MTQTHQHPSSQPVDDAIAAINDWATTEQFCHLFPNIPEKTIRWQLTRRHNNGLHEHVRMIGKQRYISISGYAEWLLQ